MDRAVFSILGMGYRPIASKEDDEEGEWGGIRR
jgi:hypothetical protein